MTGWRWWPLRRPAPPPAPGGGDWVPTHRHRKGRAYRLLAYGTLESDRSAVAIYDDDDGAVWVRSRAEFEDGRFTPLAAGDRPAG